MQISVRSTVVTAKSLRVIMYYLLFSLPARVSEKQVITIIFSDKTVLFVVKDIRAIINIIKYVSSKSVRHKLPCRYNDQEPT